MNTQTQENVMDAIITAHEHDAIFQKFGIDDYSVLIISIPKIKRTSLYVNFKKVDKSINNITWKQLEKLQQKAYKIWLSLQN